MLAKLKSQWLRQINNIRREENKKRWAPEIRFRCCNTESKLRMWNQQTIVKKKWIQFLFGSVGVVGVEAFICFFLLSLDVIFRLLGCSYISVFFFHYIILRLIDRYTKDKPTTGKQYEPANVNNGRCAIPAQFRFVYVCMKAALFFTFFLIHFCLNRIKVQISQQTATESILIPREIPHFRLRIICEINAVRKMHKSHQLPLLNVYRCAKWCWMSLQHVFCFWIKFCIHFKCWDMHNIQLLLSCAWKNIPFAKFIDEIPLGNAEHELFQVIIRITRVQCLFAHLTVSKTARRNIVIRS